jgi:hypothetical protein
MFEKIRLLFQSMGIFEVVVLLAVLIGLAAALGAASWRRRRLERRLSVEIANLGNSPSRFRLRIEDPALALQIRFFYERKPLQLISVETGEAQPAPALAFAAPAGGGEIPAQPVGRRIGSGLGIASTVSSLLMSIGNLLPSQVGRPLVQAGSKLYRGQMEVSYTQGKVDRTRGYFGKGKPRPAASQPAQAAAAATAAESLWAETPPVQPGEKLKIQVLLRSAWAAQDQLWPFRIYSYPVEAAQPEILHQESQVQTRGGFFSHALYPQLVIWLLTGAGVYLLFWLRNTGQLF